MTDEQAFADFVRHRAAALYRYGYVLSGNHHDADDLVQDALIRLRGHWSRVARGGDPVGYARTTMTRLHVSAWRRRRREVVTADPPEPAAGDQGSDRVEAAVVRDEIWTALRALPPRQRGHRSPVLRATVRRGDRDTLGVSRGTVRSQAFRALEKLRSAGLTDLRVIA